MWIGLPDVELLASRRVGTAKVNYRPSLIACGTVGVTSGNNNARKVHLIRDCVFNGLSILIVV